MCVIAFKPKGTKMPPMSTLRTCFESNPDGAGYMLPANGEVIIRKGFMEFDDFVASLLSNGDLEDVPVVMHFRISTQGGVKAGLCHPFPICGNFAEMRKSQNACAMAVAHNGIIAHCSEHTAYASGWGRAKEPDHNDTMTWIKRYANRIIAGDPFFARSANKKALLEDLQISGHSKFAIMTKYGYVHLIGEFVLDKGTGCLFSNRSYLGNEARACIPQPRQMSLWDDED